ncbi:PqqD family protein [Anaerotruncus rubiinfantis]|uniref:PqqD family protein n=1 Tax=Anaerotruncus rubiinfantis TaxID=1720200 RepID=UPI000833886C|nr:PqqD family protein [Anaerotruncus rubiinfantis]
MAKKAQQNLLDFIPTRAFSFQQQENGLVTVTVPHTGFFDRLAQLLFHKPTQSLISLDEFGSFIWLQIDGQRTVYEIGLLVQKQFGKAAEPLFERLSTFFITLRQNRFITWK